MYRISLVFSLLWKSSQRNILTFSGTLTTETPSLAWTFDTTYGIIEIYDEIEGKSDTFFAGTYGSYNTVSLSGAYYKDQISSGTQYPARFVLADDARQ